MTDSAATGVGSLYLAMLRAASSILGDLSLWSSRAWHTEVTGFLGQVTSIFSSFQLFLPPLKHLHLTLLGHHSALLSPRAQRTLLGPHLPEVHMLTGQFRVLVLCIFRAVDVGGYPWTQLSVSGNGAPG